MEAELAWMSARELLAGFRARTFRPSEALEAIARRIERLDRAVNAFTTLCLEAAEDDARRADAAWERSGRPRPLEGVPFAAKDLFDTAGVRTTYGARIFAGRVPPTDAVAVSRARVAGAILIGKAATHEFAWGITTASPHFGPTRNPWDLDRVPGGSSGGSGAALAAGLVPLALGTDTGGSIRIPAAFCGVSGHKPTFGAVSVVGAMPLAPSLDHAGALARDPRDVALLHGVLVGAAVEPPPAGLGGRRVGVVWSIPGATIGAAQARVLDEVAAALGALGARVVEVDLPGAEEAPRTFAAIQRVEALGVHVGRGLYPERAADYGDDVRARLESAQAVTAADHEAALVARRALAEAWAGLLASVDLLVMPVSAISPPPVGADRVVHLGEERDVRDLVMPYTVAQNLVGAPSCVVRAGFDDDGLPVGVQLTAAPGEDAVVLACAAELADATPDVQAPRPPDGVVGPSKRSSAPSGSDSRPGDLGS